tara:strand:- start:235 stop:606 length:372 start_codon:yes stop_codon:yes gene_type:complete
MTKLTKPITREVKLNGKEYYVTLDPGNRRSVVSFKEKGKRGRNAPFFLIPLEDLLDQLTGVKLATSNNKDISTEDMINKVSSEEEFYTSTEEMGGVPQKITLSVKGNRDEWVANIEKWCYLSK